MGESKCIVVSTTTCFLTALITSLVALASPSWVVEEYQGESQFGLFSKCDEIMFQGERTTKCSRAAISSAWQASSAFIVLGVLCLFPAIYLTVRSLLSSLHLRRAIIMAFVAAIFFSLASILFPIGFSAALIGGEVSAIPPTSSQRLLGVSRCWCFSFVCVHAHQPFKLPDNTKVGYSYILFTVSLFIIFIGELCAMKLFRCDGFGDGAGVLVAL
eukprot:m.18177 g.18177  ORF g.18177 m.18177 type:complete len:215 (-) comp29904_c0_seq2:37-681(-)